MNLRQRTPRHDQATIRGARECGAINPASTKTGA
jgi:hypothetical protein